MKFKDLSAADKKPIIDKFNSIRGILYESDSELASLYVDWVLKQLKDSYNNEKEREYQHLIRKLNEEKPEGYENQVRILKKKKYPYMAHNYPISIQKGDIVHVSFGAAYCDELSDGHYGIVLSNIIGSMYLVAPLSGERPHAGNILCYTGLKLPSKTEKNNSYVLFNQIRFLHRRRLEYFGNKGREHIDITEVDKILTIFNSML